MNTGGMADIFSDKLAEWRDYTETPWARIRYAVVAEVLQLQTAALRGGRLRILDVGGGDGMDAIPLALAGHDVSIVDPSADWLGEAERRAEETGVTITMIEGGLDDLPHGEWDLVLCHFVLRYRTAQDRDLAQLAQRVRSGGRLSIMDVNPNGRVLRELVTRGPAAAMAELHAERATVETFQTDARKVSLEEFEREAAAEGLKVIGIFGNRIVNDLLGDNEAKHEPTLFKEVLALELELSGREPFNRVGFAWQMILER